MQYNSLRTTKITDQARVGAFISVCIKEMGPPPLLGGVLETGEVRHVYTDVHSGKGLYINHQEG